MRKDAWLALIPIAIFAALTLSGAVTNPDFLMFWGVKGERIALTHGIDVEFLRDPQHLFMHPDYPPLVPAVYALSMIGSNSLHWFFAIAFAPLLLAAATFAFDRSVRNGALTALFASIFAFVYIDNAIAGNAEPFLIFFECIALGALLFDGSSVVASVALTCVVLTKVEGAAFVAAILCALAITRAMPLRRIAAIAVAPIVALASWILFCAHHGLLDAYKPHPMVAHFAILKPLISESAMGAMYMPWIVIVLLIACGRARPALPAILAAAAFVAFLIVAWLGTNVEGEIAWSAKRVLMTPMLLLLFGAASSLSARATRRTAP